jgi:hypothetical protein
MGLARSRTWIALGSTVILVAVVVLTMAWLRQRTALGPPQQSLPSQSAAPLETPPPAEDPNVLVYVTSTPPGAAIVHVSNKSVLGYTPETIQFRRSTETVSIRLELKGFAPEMRNVPTVSDSQLTVELKPTSKGARPRTGT